MPAPLERLNSGPRLLESAFESLKSKAAKQYVSKENGADIYSKYFKPLSGTVPGEPFEKFSLIDPSIRTFMTSATGNNS